jgi:hypothetical protein
MDAIVAKHPRSFGCGETTYDPWHFVPVLARNPRALRNGERHLKTRRSCSSALKS